MTGWSADSSAVKADGSGGTGVWTADGSLAGYLSDPIQAPSKLQKISAGADPAGLTATKKTATTISLVWQDVYNASSYALYRDGVRVYQGTTISFLDTGLTPSTRYQYVVKSVHVLAGESFGSTSVGVTTLAATLTDTRRWAPGWHMALGFLNGNIQNSSGTAPARTDIGPVTDYTAAVEVRYNWGALDNGNGTFNSTLIAKHLADLKKFNNTTQPNVLLYVMPVQRTFNGVVNATLTQNAAGNVSAVADGASSANLPSGAYGVSFNGTKNEVRTNVTVVRTGDATNGFVSTLAWTGNLSTAHGAITTACMNLRSNSPMPPNLLDYCEPFPNATGPPGGFQGWRWSPTVLAQWELLCAWLAATFDSHPNWGGICTQETAVGVNVVGGTGQDAYSAAAYYAGLNAEDDSIVNHCVNGRAKHYFNFINGDNPGNGVPAHFDHVQTNGGMVGPPDWPTGRSGSGIPNRVYKYMGYYQNGSNGITGTGPTMVAAQNGEYEGTGAGDPPPTAPGTWDGQFRDMYNYATQSNSYTSPVNALDHRNVAGVADPSVLNVSVATIDWPHTGSKGQFSNWLPIMAAHPLFKNPWTPT